MITFLCLSSEDCIFWLSAKDITHFSRDLYSKPLSHLHPYVYEFSTELTLATCTVVIFMSASIYFIYEGCKLIQPHMQTTLLLS